MEPEDDGCMPCSETSARYTDEDSICSHSKQSELILDYTTKIREGIANKEKKIADEVAADESPAPRAEAHKIDFHIKVIRKEKPIELLLSAKTRGNDLVFGIRSKAKRVSFALPKADETDTREGLWSRVKRISLRLLAVQSKLRKAEPQRPKNQRTKPVPITPTVGDRFVPKIEPLSPARASGTEADGAESEDEEKALLSFNSPASSPTYSSEAKHFYTPMVPSRPNRSFECFVKQGQTRKSVGRVKVVISRSMDSVKARVRNGTGIRRGRGGWSKIV